MHQPWEYITVNISGGGNTAVSDTLNKLGHEGWEAWHMLERPDSVVVFLRRMKEIPTFTLSPELADRIQNGRRRG